MVRNVAGATWSPRHRMRNHVLSCVYSIPRLYVRSRVLLLRALYIDRRNGNTDLASHITSIANKREIQIRRIRYIL